MVALQRTPHKTRAWTTSSAANKWRQTCTLDPGGGNGVTWAVRVWARTLLDAITVHIGNPILLACTILCALPPPHPPKSLACIATRDGPRVARRGFKGSVAAEDLALLQLATSPMDSRAFLGTAIGGDSSTSM